MAGTPASLELGPCIVEFGASGSEVDLGFTKGGVTMIVDTMTVNVTTDQFGLTPMKQIVVGRTATIRCPFAETDLLLMSKIVPGASHVIDAVTSTKKKTVINTPIGRDLLSADAVSLRITKAIAGVVSSNSNDKFRFYKAAPSGRIETSFSIENQRIWTVDFTAFPDSTRNFDLGTFGNETAA